MDAKNHASCATQTSRASRGLCCGPELLARASRPRRARRSREMQGCGRSPSRRARCRARRARLQGQSCETWMVTRPCSRQCVLIALSPARSLGRAAPARSLGRAARPSALAVVHAPGELWRDGDNCAGATVVTSRSRAATGFGLRESWPAVNRIPSRPATTGGSPTYAQTHTQLSRLLASSPPSPWW